MIEIELGELVESLKAVVGPVILAKQYPITAGIQISTSNELGKKMLEPIDKIERVADRMRLKVTCGRCQAIRRRIEFGAELDSLTNDLQSLIHELTMETDGNYVLFLEERESESYRAGFAGVFGGELADTFPSIVDDLDEAVKCYALGRSTACVFHLMRSLEAVVGAVWKSLGASTTKTFRGWGDYKVAIGDYLENKAKDPRPSDWKQREPFYQEVHADLTAFNRAWRNPTMHVEKTYTVERAKEIMDATKALIRHVAAHMDEQGMYSR